MFSSLENEFLTNSGAARALLLFLEPVLGTTGSNLDHGLLEPDSLATLSMGLWNA